MNKLQVPENVPLRWELWPGIGQKELVQIGTLVALACIGSFFYCQWHQAPSDMPTVSVIIFLVGALSVGFFSKTTGNQSICDFLQTLLHYYRTQQTFYYEYRQEVSRLEEAQTDPGSPDRPGLSQCRRH